VHILLTISSLSGAGGAERVMSIMANYWAEKGWAVSIITFDDGGKPPFYQLHPQVKYLAVNKKKKSGKNNSNFRKYIKIRKMLIKNKPDLIISFLTGNNIKILRYTLFSNIPVIVAERVAPVYATFSSKKKLSIRWLYPKAAFVVFQTQKMVDHFPQQIHRKSVIIPNPVPQIGEHISQPEIALPEGKLLFAIGHMSQKKMHQKGFDLLIPVFGNLSKKHPDWHLVILNDGPEKVALEKEIERHNLQNRVYLVGKVKNIFPIFKNGDLFVLSSRYEGFPNALCEAMACGLPVVSFDCPTGPGDIICNGIDGVLVPPEDVEGLEKALDALMGNEILRKKMGAKATEIVERFSMEKIMGMWEKLILGVIKT